MAKKEKKSTEGCEPVAPCAAPEGETATEPEVVAAGAQENAAAELLAQLEKTRAEADENRDGYLRARADLENYRKRAQREKEDLAKYANESILREILPVIDNLERAVQHAGSDAGENLLQGIEMTLGQFRKVLEKFGVVPVGSVGTPFDPSRHEAMGQVESAEHPANTVVQELQRGYLLNERLLRPALVMISKAPANA